MGEVYRARDTKLNRDVALKILPDAFASDADRLARFTREAQTLAALNHPHIAHIHGLEESPSTGPGQTGVRALVMEFVDGQDLAQRLAQGAIPIDEALGIARQIAAALEAAHEQGIIHRDLKPANIKLRPDGTVKVLDFGLAKAVDPRHSSPATAVLANSPTITRLRQGYGEAGGTELGVILGTAAYMAPEQARGKAVDKRADIWAFGCVLYEMLAGRAAFDGATVSDVMARVIEREPDWTALPAATPPGVRRALQKCLDKDLKRRLRDIGDLELLLEAPGAATTTSARPARGSWLAWSVAAFALLAAGLVSFRNVGETPDTSAPIRFQVDTGVKLAESQQFSISPDGRHLVFAGSGSDGVMRLWVRSLDSLETLPLSGTETDVGQMIPPMFWSPDSRLIAFDNRGQLKKIERSGGSLQTVCNLKGVGVGGTWNRDGVILVGNTDGGLVRCSAAGGAESIATALNASRQEAGHLFPSFLPDGRHFLYMRVSRTSPQNTAIYVGSLDAKPDEQGASPLLTVGLGPAFYVPTAGSRSGHVLFPRGQALLAVPFDPQKLVAAGDSLPVADAVGSYRDGASFSSSANGVLVYRAPDQDLQLTWVNRQGQPIERMGDPGRYTNVALTPDGTRAVVAREHPQNRVDRDLWLVDLQRGGSTRLTFSPSIDESPVWYPDGSRIAFSRGQRLLQQPVDANGAEQVLLQNDQTKRTTGVSPDGRFLLYVAESLDPAMKTDLWALPLAGDPKPLPVAVDQLEQLQGQFSPDGRWIAYVSNESGAYEVFVRPFSPELKDSRAVAGRKVLVSKGGGASPRWRRDGKELFYLATSGNVMAVDVDTTADFRAGSPHTLFRAANVLPEWGVSADGSRFLFAVSTGSSTPPPFTVVLNWQEALKR